MHHQASCCCGQPELNPTAQLGAPGQNISLRVILHEEQEVRACEHQLPSLLSKAAPGRAMMLQHVWLAVCMGRADPGYHTEPPGTEADARCSKSCWYLCNVKAQGDTGWASTACRCYSVFSHPPDSRTNFLFPTLKAQRKPSQNQVEGTLPSNWCRWFISLFTIQ